MFDCNNSMKAQIIQFQMQLNLTLIILFEFNNSYSNAHQSSNKIPMRIILQYYKYVQISTSMISTKISKTKHKTSIYND
jgi:hypothetical protein